MQFNQSCACSNCFGAACIISRTRMQSYIADCLKQSWTTLSFREVFSGLRLFKVCISSRCFRLYSFCHSVLSFLLISFFLALFKFVFIFFICCSMLTPARPTSLLIMRRFSSFSLFWISFFRTSCRDFGYEEEETRLFEGSLTFSDSSSLQTTRGVSWSPEW